MPSLLTIRSVSLGYGGEPLLDDVSLSIAPGDHICLVGRNGCGKSTLLRVLAGEVEPDAGEIVRQPGLRVASLPQDVPEGLDGTVADVVRASARGSASGEPAGGASSSVAAAAITRLGLDPSAPFASLSGGQRRRCLLARALAAEPDVLLLDEPTNHLDIATIEWLEDYLASRVATFVFVTHDRAFLRRLARRIVDLDRGRLNGWDCDYDTFLQRKRQVLEDEEAVYEKMGKRLKREEAWLRRGVKARTTRNEGRVRALMELRKAFAGRRAEEGTSAFEIQGAERSGQRVMRIRDLTFAYPGEPPLIKGFTRDILRGERIGILGPNGAGKTTFVRLLAGELAPTSGEIIPGSNLSVVYFDQLRQRLDPERSVADNVSDGHDNVSVAGQTRHVLSYLGDFLFTPERARTPVKALSGGERGRLMLARLFLDACNLLILDEPTNDLDIETLDLLEDQLAAFDGTVILISHDRAFLDNTVTSTLVFEPDGLHSYPGGYSDWREAAKARADAVRPAGEAKAPKGAAARQKAEEPPRRDGAARRLSYNERREYEGLPARIEALEAEEADLNARLSDPEVYRQPPAEIKAWHDRVSAIPAEIEVLMARWAELDERA